MRNGLKYLWPEFQDNRLINKKTTEKIGKNQKKKKEKKKEEEKTHYMKWLAT